MPWKPPRTHADVLYNATAWRGMPPACYSEFLEGLRMFNGIFVWSHAMSYADFASACHSWGNVPDCQTSGTVAVTEP